MGLKLEQYKNMIQNLLPVGLAWPREKETNMEGFLFAIAGEPNRVDCRIQDMLRESYPLTASELLTDWETTTGLPEECEGLGSTIQRRREAVDQKLSTTGGQSPGFYIDVAARLGYEITITDQNDGSPFRVGENAAGDALGGEDWAHTWIVNAPEETIQYFRSGQSAAGEPLANWGNELLECVLNRLKPAHTIVIFTYGT